MKLEVVIHLNGFQLFASISIMFRNIEIQNISGEGHEAVWELKQSGRLSF